MDIETDIERIKPLAEAKEDENWRFRAYLKGLDLSGADLDRLVWRHLEDITRRIDCRTCGNCCTVVSPLRTHERGTSRPIHHAYSRKRSLDRQELRKTHASSPSK